MKEEIYHSNCPCNQVNLVGASKKLLQHSMRNITPEDLLELESQGIRLRQIGRPVILDGISLDAVTRGRVIQNEYGKIPPRKDGKFPDFYMDGRESYNWSHYPMVFYEIIKDGDKK